MSDSRIDPRLLTAVTCRLPSGNAGIRLCDGCSFDHDDEEEACDRRVHPECLLRAAREQGADAVMTMDGGLVKANWRRACPDHTIDQGFDPAGPAPRCGRCEVQLVPLDTEGGDDGD